MAMPVVASQFVVGKNRIIHKPTTATFSFETGHVELLRALSLILCRALLAPRLL
jgi:hypothetical protein